MEDINIGSTKMDAKKQIKLIFTVILSIISIFFIILCVKTTQIISDMNASEKKTTNVLILTTDEMTDQSWGSLAYKGKLLIEKQFDVQVSMEDEVDIDSDLKNLIKANNNEKELDLVIGHGREFSEAFYTISNQFKDIQFVTIHGDYLNSNLTVYTFDHQEMEYVAGVAAALQTKTNKIGVIDAVNNEHSDWGFSSGIEAINPKIELLYEVVYSREDKERALSIAEKMIDDGVDIIYTKGNGYNQAVINYAKTKGIYMIGYLEDQSYMAENHMLTSVLNNVPQMYVAILKDFQKDLKTPEKKVYLDSYDGVYGLAPLGKMYTEDEIEIIEQEKKEILSQNKK